MVNCHNACVAAGQATARKPRIAALDRIMVYLPLFHVNPQMYGVMSALVKGASILLLKHFSVASFFDDAIRFGATGCTFVGTVLSILVGRHTKERSDRGMRFCFGGGALRDVWKTVETRYVVKVYKAYGVTEIRGWSSANTVDDWHFWLLRQAARRPGDTHLWQ